ncbi:hypothetical protein SLE2022_340130 [Rubroshorea leprosula]
MLPFKPLLRISSPLSTGEPQLSSNATPTCNSQTCKLRPDANSNKFEANVASVLIILFCVLICALTLNAAIRCFLRGGGRSRRRRGESLPQTQQETVLRQRKPDGGGAAASLVAAPAVAYTVGMELAGTEAECIICLAEFVEGEGIQVLGRCKHGFHEQCIRQWLNSHSSCPTCRSSCLSPSPLSSSEAPDHCMDRSARLGVPELPDP